MELIYYSLYLLFLDRDKMDGSIGTILYLLFLEHLFIYSWI